MSLHLYIVFEHGAIIFLCVGIVMCSSNWISIFYDKNISQERIKLEVLKFFTKAITYLAYLSIPACISISMISYFIDDNDTKKKWAYLNNIYFMWSFFVFASALIYFVIILIYFYFVIIHLTIIIKINFSYINK